MMGNDIYRLEFRNGEPKIAGEDEIMQDLLEEIHELTETVNYLADLILDMKKKTYNDSNQIEFPI